MAEQRTQKILDNLHTLSKCCHPAVYEYTNEELEKIFAAIEKGLQDVKETFAGSKRFTLVEDGETK